MIVVIVQRVAALAGGRLASMRWKQHPAAFDVAQEPVAQALALGRALDQARDVGDHEAALVRSPTTPRLGTRVVNG